MSYPEYCDNKEVLLRKVTTNLYKIYELQKSQATRDASHHTAQEANDSRIIKLLEYQNELLHENNELQRKQIRRLERQLKIQKKQLRKQDEQLEALSYLPGGVPFLAAKTDFEDGKGALAHPASLSDTV